MSYYQFHQSKSDNNKYYNFNLHNFLQTGRVPQLSWQRLKHDVWEARRARVPAPVLLLVFVIFVISYVSFIVAGACQGQDEKMCSDNFLLQPPILRKKLSSANIFKQNLNLAQNNSQLLEYILENHIFPPEENSPDKLNKFPSYFKSTPPGVKPLVKLLNSVLNLKPGFFVEVDCRDWETSSKTLSLERSWGWSGLLMESDGKAFSGLRRKQRKAFLADVCISTSDKAQEVRFQVNEQFPALAPIQLEHSTPAAVLPVTTTRENTFLEEKLLRCFPVFSILSALNRTTVDFFSLNAHGAELKVLRTIPFHSLFIKVFAIDNGNSNGSTTREIQNFLESKGYQLFPAELLFGGETLVFIHSRVL